MVLSAYSLARPGGQSTISPEQARRFLVGHLDLLRPIGPQFIAKDFKEYIRLTGMTHVRTSPYYPQSNGKLERYHKTIKSDAIRPGAPHTLDEARALVAKFVEHYNTVRLHSAIGYITPADFLAGRRNEIAGRPSTTPWLRSYPDVPPCARSAPRGAMTLALVPTLARHAEHAPTPVLFVPRNDCPLIASPVLFTLRSRPPTRHVHAEPVQLLAHRASWSHLMIARTKCARSSRGRPSSA